MKNLQDWEAVIGLEIHVELNTKSKLFSSAPNRFGDEPNTNIGVVCTGQPGSLPVLNREAVQKAVRFGCAIGSKVARVSRFDRKSYFYPDSPRNFQITQFYNPILTGGTIVAEVEGVERQFAVEHAHLEDDAGMLKHFSSFAGVDYNRAGVPLLEIVSTPCMRTPKEASAYAIAVKKIMQYVDASDCNMEEGSLRIDANISVRKRGESALRNKVEIKNMNSFSFLELALQAEIERQIRVYESASEEERVIEQATYRWDPAKKETVLMRSKEHAEDYRYCPEPDLPPIFLTQKYIDQIQNSLPELPLAKYRRYIQEIALSAEAAHLLTSDKALADYFEEGLLYCKNGRSLCNWITVEFAGRLKDSGRRLVDLLPVKEVAALVCMIDEGVITGKIAKSVADDLVKDPTKRVKEIVSQNPDYQPLNQEREIEAVVDQVLAEHQQIALEVKAGRERAFSFLVGQVMRLTKGKASPKLVNTLLQQKIGE